MGRPERKWEELRNEEREQDCVPVFVEVETGERTVICWFVEKSAHGCGVASIPGKKLTIGSEALVFLPPRSRGAEAVRRGVVRHSNGWRHGIELKLFYDLRGIKPPKDLM